MKLGHLGKQVSSLPGVIVIVCQVDSSDARESLLREILRRKKVQLLLDFIQSVLHWGIQHLRQGLRSPRAKVHYLAVRFA